MSVRDQNLDAVAPVLATFTIKQTAGVDDLKDVNIGQPVKLTASGEVGPIGAADAVPVQPIPRGGTAAPVVRAVQMRHVRPIVRWRKDGDRGPWHLGIHSRGKGDNTAYYGPRGYEQD